MNKPAAKEPSMDEILSSIRQIIADDDAATTPPARPDASEASAAPLALSPAQMLPKTEPVRSAPPPIPREVPSFSTAFDDDDEGEESDAAFDEPSGEAELIDPEDVAFESDPEPPPPAPPPVYRAPQPTPQPRRAEPPPPRPAMSVSQAAPMPDPSLSSDMAEELLAPATNAAVQGTFSKLSALATVGNGQTIESMMREMLRPMLKEWLDENLPSVVERMVEKEIGRISRGVK